MAKVFLVIDIPWLTTLGLLTFNRLSISRNKLLALGIMDGLGGIAHLAFPSSLQIMGNIAIAILLHIIVSPLLIFAETVLTFKNN